MLKNNNIDLLIDSLPIENLSKDEYIMRKISEEKYFFSCNQNNKFLLNSKITLELISKQDLIVPSITTSTLVN